MGRMRGARVLQWCSRECYRRTASHGSEHQQWTGGRWIAADGYVYVLVPREERTGHTCRLLDGRYIAEHVLIVERTLGRCMRRGEVVHHVDCDRSNNRRDNLLVCSHAYHMWLHFEMARRWAREHLRRPTPH